MGAKNLQFKVGMPVNKKSYGLNEDGTLTIVGVASTTNKDLHDEIVTPQAIESLKEQAINRNLHLDHNHDYLGGIGVVKDAYIEDNELYVVATILPEFAQGIKERLDLGMNFGLSIAGIPIRSNRNPNVIEDYELLEISLTLLPANWDTYGTVESKGFVVGGCLTGVCDYILKKELGETMVEETPNVEEEIREIVEETVDEVLNGENEEEKDLVLIQGDEVPVDELEQIAVPTELSLKEVNEFVDDKINKAFAEKEDVLKEAVVEEVKSAMGNEFKDEITSSLKEYIDETTKIETEEKEEKLSEEEVEDVVEKSVAKILSRLDQRRGGTGKFQSTISNRGIEKKSFLGNGERDQFGRNKKYL